MEEMNRALEQLMSNAERLGRAAASMEVALEVISGRVPQITATVEQNESALELRIAELERQMAELHASAAAVQAAGILQVPAATSGRRTLPASTANLLAKHGMSEGSSIEVGALDGALTSLPIEQRIAVKAQLMRAGMLA